MIVLLALYNRMCFKRIRISSVIRFGVRSTDQNHSRMFPTTASLVGSRCQEPTRHLLLLPPSSSSCPPALLPSSHLHYTQSTTHNPLHTTAYTQPTTHNDAFIMFRRMLYVLLSLYIFRYFQWILILLCLISEKVEFGKSKGQESNSHLFVCGIWIKDEINMK